MLLTAATGLVLAVGACGLLSAGRGLVRSNGRWSVVALLPLMAGSLASGLSPSRGQQFVAMGLAASLAVVAAPRVDRSSTNSSAPASIVPHLFALGLVSWLAIKELAGNPVSTAALIGCFASVGLILACAAISRGGGIKAADLRVLVLAYLSTAMVLSAVSGSAWTSCREGKCTAVGELYRSGFQSENTPALVAGLLLLLALLDRGESWRCALVVGVTVLVLTGGRTAIGAVALALAIAMSLGLVSRSRAGRGFRVSPWLAVLVSSGIAGVGLWVAWHSKSTTLSNRGRTWNAALELVAPSNLIGRRASDWDVLRTDGVLPDHSAHSMYVHVLFAGGLLGVLLLIGVMSAALAGRRGRTRAELAKASAVPIFIGVAGLTEVVWNPATVDQMLVFVLALLALSPWPERLKSHLSDRQLEAAQQHA